MVAEQPAPELTPSGLSSEQIDALMENEVGWQQVADIVKLHLPDGYALGRYRKEENSIGLVFKVAKIEVGKEAETLSFCIGRDFFELETAEEKGALVKRRVGRCCQIIVRNQQGRRGDARS